MPPLKTPSTLYNIALAKTRLSILRFGEYLIENVGDYENAKCRDIIQETNQYLTSNVPASIIDELYNCVDAVIDSENQTVASKNNNVQCVVLPMYVNKNMTCLMTHKVVHDPFWLSIFPSLEKLTKLDLNKVCSDELLELVGKHCKNLEYVNIVSKSCHSRTKDRHNALKLQLCVSNEGLKYLSNCKRLKEIQMTCLIRRGCGGRQITNGGVALLLVSLPKLRRINYTYTGLVLDRIPVSFGPLALVTVIDYHPCEGRIPKLEVLCPNLQELHMTYAFSPDDYRSDVITALTGSKLKLTTLSLTNFPFDDTLKKYFEMKGSGLKSFDFTPSSVDSVNELFKLLGKSCPDLDNLSIHIVIYDANSSSNRYSFDSYLEDYKMFCKLKCLVIKGMFWDFAYILPLLLKNAEFIQKVILTNAHLLEFVDETLHLIQKSNRFLNLETVGFLKGINVSFEYLKEFIYSCPVLKNVTIENESQAYCNRVKQLRQELKRRNYDVNIEVYGFSY